MYVGSADRFEIRAYDLSGRPVQALRRPGQPERVEKADIQSEIERAVAETGGTRRAAVEASYAALTFPTTLPAYTALVVDADDRVWVRAFARGAANAARWSVFDADGTLLAEVELPKALTVFEIGTDYVLGRYLDPDESIPLVRLYRLTRGATGAR